MKKLSKKTLSVLLAALMLLSVIPGFSLTATADNDSYYLFAYFTGNAVYEQKLNFALSDDGLNFKSLNGNQPIVMPEKTSANNSSGCARDPYIARAQDGSFYMIATDMDASEKWDGDTCLYVWHSEDLVNWNQITDLDVSAAGAFEGVSGTATVTAYDDPADTSSYLRTLDFGTTIRAWAPQFIWDENEQAYMVYWSNYFDSWRCVVAYSYTNDFINFSAPQVLFVAPNNSNGDWQAAIDEDIHYNSADNTWYMYYKDEQTGTICYVTSDSLTGPYTLNPTKVLDTNVALEGANCHMVGDKLTMFADAYLDSYFVALQSTDFKTFTQLNYSDYDINQLNPRHGSVVQITKAEYDRMAATYGLSTATDISYDFTYPYFNSWWKWDTYKDSSGYKCIMRPGDGLIKINKGTGYATVDRSYIFFNHDEPTAVNMLPDDVYTISLDVILENAANKDAPILTLSRGNSESDTEDYFMLFGNGDVWLQESGASTDHWMASTEIKEGVQYTFTLVSDGTTISLYKNGTLVCSENATIDFPSSGERFVGLGWSYDHPWTLGCYAYSNIRFRDYAISAAEVKAEYKAPQLIYQYNEGTDVYLDKYDVTKLNTGIQANAFDNGTATPAYTISAWVHPGATIDSDAALIEFGDGFTNGVEDDSKKYFTILEDGRIFYCWGDGTTTHFLDLYDYPNKFDLTNTWQLLTIVVYPYINYEAVKVYINDELQYTATAAGENIEGTDYTINKYMRAPRNVYLGKGNAYWQTTANSYIDDVRIYAGAYDINELYAIQQKDYQADIAKKYVETNINSMNSQYVNFTATAYHEGNNAVNGYGNVVYATQNTEWRTIGTSNDGDYAKIKHLKLKLPMPSKIVLVYDGVHTAALPIELESITYKTGNTNYNPNMRTLWCTNGSFHLDHYWYGFLNGDYQSWAGSTITADNADAKIGYGNGADYDFDSGEQDNVNTTRFWWNKLNYTGTGNTVDYYEAFNTNEANRIGFNLYLRDKNTDYSNEALYNENSNIYVINYQPIYSILDSARNYYNNTVKGNEWIYTEESLNDYFIALHSVMTCNPNNYDYADGVEAAVQSCAADVKNATEKYNAINLQRKEFTVTYNLANSVETETVYAGDCLANIPQNTAMASDYDSETHTTYSWPSEVTTSYMPLGDVSFDEIAQVSSCVDNNSDTKCDICGQQLKIRADWSAFDNAKSQLEAALAASNDSARHNPEALQAVNDAIAAITYYNSSAEDKHDVLATDQAVIDAQVEAINNALTALQNDVAENDDVYEEFAYNVETLNADAMNVTTVQAAVNSVSAVSSVEVNGNQYNAYTYDNYITEYLSQMNTDSNYIPYTVTVETADGRTLYVKDNGDGTYSCDNNVANASNFYYGDEITLKNPNVPETSNYACSWAVSAKPVSSENGTALKHMAYANTFTFNVRGDMTVVTGNSRTEGSRQIIFMQSLRGTKTDKILDVQYVEDGTAFLFANAVIPVSVAFHTLDDSPYSVSYDGGATTTKLSGSSFTPTGDCIVYVNYSGTNNDEYIINFFNVNDAYDYVSAKFNEPVTLTDANAKAFVTYDDKGDLDPSNDTTTVLCYGSTYSFFACQDIDIFAVADIDEVASVSVIPAPVVDHTSGKTYLVGNFALPAGCTAQSYGFVMDGCEPEHDGLSLADLDKDDFIINLTTSNCTNKGQRGNQFSVKFNNLNTMLYMPSYVAYVIYTDANGNTQYAYSEVIMDADFS